MGTPCPQTDECHVPQICYKIHVGYLSPLEFFTSFWSPATGLWQRVSCSRPVLLISSYRRPGYQIRDSYPLSFGLSDEQPAKRSQKPVAMDLTPDTRHLTPNFVNYLGDTTLDIFAIFGQIFNPLTIKQRNLGALNAN